MGPIILFSLLLILITLSVPIGIALGISTAVTMVLTSDIPLVMISQNAFASLDSFPLMAIPFFILAGSIMTYGGLSKRLVATADAMVGFITGGLGIVTTLACMFFGAISGSGPATVSAIGSFMIPSMKEKNYDEGFATALTAAAGTIGVIIPPSIPFVVFGVVSGASIGEMFIGGIIPGILIGIALMGTCYIISKKRGYVGSGKRPSLKGLLNTFKDSFWALITPVIVLGGIYGGIFTPTEAAVVSIVYGVIIGKFVYKELDFKIMYDSIKESALLNGITVFTIGLSMAFASYLAMDQIPTKLAQALLSVSDNKIIILLLVNIFLLIVGCFVDNISSMIILTPVFLPVMVQLGVEPVQFGIFMTIALAIGFVTPPYGANLFIASAISGLKIEEISTHIIWFIFALLICLFLITYIPSLSMALPELLRG